MKAFELKKTSVIYAGSFKKDGKTFILAKGQFNQKPVAIYFGKILDYYLFNN